MHVDATDAARAVVQRARQERTGALSITIGTGCCESTAPFLYEDYYPGPDQAQVGDVDGVPVFAPGYLRSMYPDDDGVTVDALEVDAESLSVETAWGWRLILRGHGVDTGREDVVCTVDVSDPDRPGARVRGELPEALQRLGRIR
ncbi:MAG: DUF779 domain-containing protein [Acidimicrobiia bacterium]|nr:DUF779 domain-containing protein [Acidimicrobiia bacterium]